VAYTEEQLQQAGRALANEIRALKERQDALESGPVRQQMQADWDSGRRHARSRGYGDGELDRLETDIMVRKGIVSHADAMRLDPTPPSGKGWFLKGLPADELKLAMEGKLDEFERLSTSRALRGE
jgi:hypothetical protein